MKKFNDQQLNEIKNDIIETIDDNLDYMIANNREELIKMLIRELKAKIVKQDLYYGG